jgi:hypothetical protein
VLIREGEVGGWSANRCRAATDGHDATPGRSFLGAILVMTVSVEPWERLWKETSMQSVLRKPIFWVVAAIAAAVVVVLLLASGGGGGGAGY